jgi:hypothetical protein
VAGRIARNPQSLGANLGRIGPNALVLTGLATSPVVARPEIIVGPPGDFQFHQQRRPQWFPVDAIAERLPLEHFHHKERLTILFVDVVDGADVRMVERGGRACLALEALQGLAVAGQLQGQKFQCNGTLQTVIFRAIHNAHSSTAELFDDAVMGNGATDERRRVHQEIYILGSVG